jgi:hypothetical protein
MELVAMMAIWVKRNGTRRKELGKEANGGKKKRIRRFWRE